MSYLDTALGVAGGLGRAYGGYQRAGQQRPTTPGFGAPYGAQQPQSQQQPQQGGLLMQYLRGRMQKPGSQAPGHEQVTDMQPNGSTSADGGMGGMQIPMGPAPPIAGPPMQQNPYPGTPPIMDTSGQQFGSGGIVDRPTTAIIGEDGPEMVVPLSGRPDAKVSPRNIPQMNYGRR